MMVQGQDIRQRVNQVLVSEFNVVKDNLTPSADLFNDLELDSLELVEFIDSLEKIFDRQMDRDFLRNARTLEDVYQRLEEILMPVSQNV